MCFPLPRVLPSRLSPFPLTILLLAALPWWTIADDDPTDVPTLETNSSSWLYFQVNFAIERFDDCDPTAFGLLDFSQKRAKVVQLFERYGLIERDTEWPRLVEPLASADSVTKWKADFDWTAQLEGQELAKAMNKYYRRSGYSSKDECSQLMKVMMNEERVTEGKDIIEEHILVPMRKKYNDGEVWKYVKAAFPVFHDQLAAEKVPYLNFWFEALLACNVDQQMPRFSYDGYDDDDDGSYLSNIKPLLEPAVIQAFFSEVNLWPEVWVDSAVLRDQYDGALSEPTFTTLMNLSELYWREGSIGPLPVKLLRLLQLPEGRFCLPMILSMTQLFGGFKVVKPEEPSELGLLFRRKLNLQLFLLATEKVYKGKATGTFYGAPDKWSQRRVPKGQPKRKFWCSSCPRVSTKTKVVGLIITSGSFLALGIPWVLSSIANGTVTTINQASASPTVSQNLTTELSFKNAAWITWILSAVALLFVFALAGYAIYAKMIRRHDVARKAATKNTRPTSSPVATTTV